MDESIGTALLGEIVESDEDNPNVILRKLREWAKDYGGSFMTEVPAAKYDDPEGYAIELFRKLDASLSKEGYLPDDWDLAKAKWEV